MARLLNPDRVTICLYRLEQGARSPSGDQACTRTFHGPTRTWVTAQRDPITGKWTTKSFAFRRHGGPVIAWLFACDYLAELEAQHGNVLLHRVPRPHPHLIAEQFRDSPL